MVVRPRKTRDIAGKAWVTFVTLLISFLAFTPQLFIIGPWYLTPPSSLAHTRPLLSLFFLLAPFNLIIYFLFRNYFLVVTTDPGGVPPGWTPPTIPVGGEMGDEGGAARGSRRWAEGTEVKRLTGVPRYCKMCDEYKPPRAHHCKTCKRCILRMDHHCPWVNNCVGHHNYAHFVRFLICVDIACVYQFCMVTSRVIDAANPSPYWRDVSTREMLLIVFNYVGCIPTLLTVGIFSIYQFYLLATNTTTIESWEKDKVATLVRRGRIREVKFPYHLGLYRNLVSIFGPKPILWPLPAPTPGDGLSYPVNDSSDRFIQYTWPPRDPITRYRYDPSPSGGGGQRRRHKFELPSSPWTYGGEDVNPRLKASNARLQAEKRQARGQAKMASSAMFDPNEGGMARRRRRGTRGDEQADGAGGEESDPPRRKPGRRSDLPPYHPDYRPQGENDEEDSSDSLEERRARRFSSGSSTDDDMSHTSSENSATLAGADGCVPLYAHAEQQRREGRERGEWGWTDENVFIDDEESQRDVDADDWWRPAPDSQVRIRRGSEGYEVRPAGASAGFNNWTVDVDGDDPIARASPTALWPPIVGHDRLDPYDAAATAAALELSSANSNPAVATSVRPLLPSEVWRAHAASHHPPTTSNSSLRAFSGTSSSSLLASRERLVQAENNDEGKERRFAERDEELGRVPGEGEGSVGSEEEEEESDLEWNS